MKSNRHRVKIPLRDAIEAHPVPVIADGAIAMARLGEGRTIPVLILDTSARPDVENLITSQLRAGIVGDVESRWSFKRRFGQISRPLLLLKFTKPGRCLLIIEFELPRQGVLVDQILWSRGVFVQPGRPGDRLADTLNCPRLSIEVPPNETFRREFERVYRKAIFRRFRRGGMSRTHAKQGVDSYLQECRRVLQRRIRFRRPSQVTASEPSDDPSGSGSS